MHPGPARPTTSCPSGPASPTGASPLALPGARARSADEGPHPKSLHETPRHGPPRDHRTTMRRCAPRCSVARLSCGARRPPFLPTSRRGPAPAHHGDRSRHRSHASHLDLRSRGRPTAPGSVRAQDGAGTDCPNRANHLDVRPRPRPSAPGCARCRRSECAETHLRTSVEGHHCPPAAPSLARHRYHRAAPALPTLRHHVTHHHPRLCVAVRTRLHFGATWDRPAYPTPDATKPPHSEGFVQKRNPAATYSPRGSLPKYHRRWRA